jgi:hypothetical protein
LIELENFIYYNNDVLKFIEFKDSEKEKKKEEQILLKKRGEKDVNIILDTSKIIIYSPTSENGSKYYGRNTRWCTAAKENCMFDYYNESGPLYIIQSKEDSKHKYQLHIEVKQVMDTKDEPVSIKDIKLDFQTAFIICCTVGNFDMVKWLHNKTYFKFIPMFLFNRIYYFFLKTPYFCKN